MVPLQIVFPSLPEYLRATEENFIAYPVGHWGLQGLNDALTCELQVETNGLELYSSVLEKEVYDVWRRKLLVWRNTHHQQRLADLARADPKITLQSEKKVNLFWLAMRTETYWLGQFFIYPGFKLWIERFWRFWPAPALLHQTSGVRDSRLLICPLRTDGYATLKMLDAIYRQAKDIGLVPCRGTFIVNEWLKENIAPYITGSYGDYLRYQAVNRMIAKAPKGACHKVCFVAINIQECFWLGALYSLPLMQLVSNQLWQYIIQPPSC